MWSTLLTEPPPMPLSSFINIQMIKSFQKRKKNPRAGHGTLHPITETKLLVSGGVNFWREQRMTSMVTVFPKSVPPLWSWHCLIFSLVIGRDKLVYKCEKSQIAVKWDPTLFELAAFLGNHKVIWNQQLLGGLRSRNSLCLCLRSFCVAHIAWCRASSQQMFRCLVYIFI